jgi:hypothetical protein
MCANGLSSGLSSGRQRATTLCGSLPVLLLTGCPRPVVEQLEQYLHAMHVVELVWLGQSRSAGLPCHVMPAMPCLPCHQVLHRACGAGGRIRKEARLQARAPQEL